MTFEQWWDSERASYHWSLKHHYKDVWEAAQKHARPTASEGEVEALREANKRFAERQEWWNQRMVELEEERAKLRAELDKLKHV